MILLLLGLLLTVIALPVSDKKDSSPEVKSSSFFSASSEKNTDAERTVLEKKLEDLLSQTEGVGKVRSRVMRCGNHNTRVALIVACRKGKGRYRH